MTKLKRETCWTTSRLALLLTSGGRRFRTQTNRFAVRTDVVVVVVVLRCFSEEMVVMMIVSLITIEIEIEIGCDSRFR